MGIDDFSNTGLVLGLGLHPYRSKKPASDGQNLSDKPSEPSLTLTLSGDSSLPQIRQVRQSTDVYGQDSTASSFSNVSVKRERDSGSDEVGIDRVSDDDGSNGRKKLRLTKIQSAMLEECFKQHSTLNPKQKLELARELKLRPRQVEVWFQNRRARTKLKQTELDCEYLKKCCDTLTEENRRLQRELQELKAVKLAQPLYMAATLSMCPSCERIGGAGAGGGGSAAQAAAKSPFAMSPKPQLFNLFSNPSAAC